MAFFQPLYLVDRRIGSRFDAAMIGVDRLVPADRRVLETIGFLLGGGHADILAQGSLIALERDDVIGLLVDDFPAFADIPSRLS
jgi:hypothetical protein